MSPGPRAYRLTAAIINPRRNGMDPAKNARLASSQAASGPGPAGSKEVSTDADLERASHLRQRRMTMDLMRPTFEHVVLVDDANQPIGTSRKHSIHHAHTPLHRGFSVFLFDRAGQTLLQQRSRAKLTWPGVWSNACCGHPQLHESTIAAMNRRLDEELGLGGVRLDIMLPNYRYRFMHDGIVENEFCPVAVGVVDEVPHPNPREVQDLRWVPWDEFLNDIGRDSSYSEWCVEEAGLLARDPAFRAFHAGLGLAPT